ncbi:MULTISPECIES: recombinase family protein [unclassified Streptomyces]|uniref:recombinase family protein n=1 Tax=unclassified Streptomyces TaxID=2593676 RepID=UPI0033A9EDE8
MRAAIYVRLSRETENSTSPERQRAACEALCAARGWQVIAVEEDIDVSGYSRGLDRPGLQRILARLAEFDVIVFFKTDRLARSTVDFAEIMKVTQAEGVALASASEPLDLTSSMGRAMAKVLAVFAELESDTIGMRVSSAHEHLRREGRYTGGRVPYGYRAAPNPDGAGKVLEVNPEEAKTIHEIVERVLNKDSLLKIAVDLTESDKPSPGHSSRQTTGKRGDSKRWYPSTLRSLLGNPQLLGQVIEDGKPILMTDGLPLVNRTPILDMDTWQALQDELSRRANPGDRRREGTALLRGDRLLRGVPQPHVHVRRERPHPLSVHRPAEGPAGRHGADLLRREHRGGGHGAAHHGAVPGGVRSVPRGTHGGARGGGLPPADSAGQGSAGGP